jgi:hypothetical protein
MGSKSFFVNFTVWASTLGGVFCFNRFIDVSITNGRFSNIKTPLYGGAICMENCENVFVSKMMVFIMILMKKKEKKRLLVMTKKKERKKSSCC